MKIVVLFIAVIVTEIRPREKLALQKLAYTTDKSGMDFEKVFLQVYRNILAEGPLEMCEMNGPSSVGSNSYIHVR